MSSQDPRDIEHINRDDSFVNTNTNTPPLDDGEEESANKKDVVKGSVVKEPAVSTGEPKKAPSKSTGGKHAA